MSTVAIVLLVLLFFVLGLAAGWILSVRHFRRQMDENPPISEQHVRELYRQAGRKLSEKQIAQIMNSFKR